MFHLGRCAAAAPLVFGWLLRTVHDLTADDVYWFRKAHILPTVAACKSTLTYDFDPIHSAGEPTHEVPEPGTGLP